MDINKELDKIGTLLTDKNVKKIKAENQDENFGALTMLTVLQREIYPILEGIRTEINKIYWLILEHCFKIDQSKISQ